MPVDATPLPSDAPPLVNGTTYEVSTPSQLEYMDEHQSQYLSDSTVRIVLMNDIDLSTYIWVPFGETETPFSGDFNGQMHRIIGLSVTGTGELPVGLFGEVTGSIENIGVTGAVNGGGNGDVGILVGRLDGSGSITDSFTSGTVSGGDGNGGLVGSTATGTHLRDSFSTANVTGIVDSTDGGLVGLGYGDIADSYASGTVTGGGAEGGIAGYLDSGTTLCDSYFSGAVFPIGEQLGASLVATDEGRVSNTFFDKSFNKVGNLPGVGQGAAEGLGTGEPTPEMQKESTFTSAGWDFSGTWGISPSINGGYPYLRAWSTSSVTSSVSDAASAQSVPVNVVVDYAGQPVNHAFVTLSVNAGDGTWQSGTVTDSVYTQVYSPSIDTWITPVVDNQTSVTITAAVYAVPSLESTVFITVEPPLPGAPTNLQHIGVTDSGWTETWDPVLHAQSYRVYVNNAFVGSAPSPSFPISGKQASTQYDVAVSAVNSSGQVGPSAHDGVTTNATVVVQPQPAQVPPQILTQSLPAATVGQPYDFQLAGSGGASPLQWTVASGSLPTGMNLDANGRLSGTPTGVGGQDTFTVQLVDATHLNATASLTLLINGAPLPPPVPPEHPSKPVYVPLFYAVFQGIRGENQYGPNSFDITSVQYGWSQNHSSGSGKAQGVVGKRELPPIVFTKSADSVSLQVMNYAAIGKQFMGDFYAQKLVQGRYIRYFHLHFVGRVVAVQSSVSSGNHLTDTIEIQPGMEQFTGVQPNGSSGAQSTSNWDLASQKSP